MVETFGWGRREIHACDSGSVGDGAAGGGAG